MHGYLNTVAKSVKELQRNQHVLQKLTAKGLKKQLKHHYL